MPALLLVAVVVVWRLYLPGPEGDPFTGGPRLTEATGATATPRPRFARPGDAVQVRAVGPDAGEVTARDGELRGLTPRHPLRRDGGGRRDPRAAGTLRLAPADLSRPLRVVSSPTAGRGRRTGGRAAAWPRHRTRASPSWPAISPIAVPALLDRTGAPWAGSTLRA